MVDRVLLQLVYNTHKVHRMVYKQTLEVVEMV